MTEPITTTNNAIASTPEGMAPHGASSTGPRSLPVRIISTLGFAAIAIVGVLIVLFAWELPPFGSAIESTKNALVRGQVTVIGPKLSGYVFEVPVQDFQFVKNGDLLVRLDVTRAANAQAVAGVAQAQASLEISRQDLQTVIVNRGSLEAAVASDEAAVELARIDLSNTSVVAPQDGQLGQISVRLGAYVNSGPQLMMLVPNQLWVMVNMKETQMNNIHIGQPVTFTVDALNHQKFHGRVQRISPATDSEFSLLQPDNATGNFVTIAQRIPVRITVDSNQA
ncbi:HlyD family secretion protein [Pseudomonas sp. TH41]|nr:HlyD family secretion protein [Pseudomonas sp. TH41]MBK5356094.1 HlyD family secretion protein [Pseudomonas sp. TH41]